MARKLLVMSTLHIIARVAALSLSISLITAIDVYDSYTIATLVCFDRYCLSNHPLHTYVRLFLNFIE